MRAQVDGLRNAIGDAAAPIAAAFKLAPDTVVRAFESAGLTEVTFEQVKASVSLPSLDEFAIGQVATLPVAPAFAARPIERRQAYLDEMKRVLAPHRSGMGTYDCTFASWVVTGSR